MLQRSDVASSGTDWVTGVGVPESIRVLHVDDDEALRPLVADFLEREADELTVTSAASGRDGLDRLSTTRIDCIVSDYQMPGMDGLQFLDAVREEYPELPFVLFTGKGSEEIASEAISRGVTDYLQKRSGTNQYAVLANRITNAVDGYRSRRVLEKRTQSLEQAQRLADLGHWEWNIVDDTLYWSDEIYRIFGVEPDAFDASYDAFLEFVHPDDREAVRTAVDAALDDDHTYSIEHRIVRADGAQRVVHESGEVIRDGDEAVAMRGVVQDVSDRVQRSRNLRAFREAVERAGHAIYWTDSDGTIQYVNPAFEAITGYSNDEVVGRNPNVLQSGVHDDDLYDRLWETILDGGTWEGTLVNERKDGTRYIARQTIAPIENETGDITRFVSVSTDVSGRGLLPERDAGDGSLLGSVRCGTCVFDVDGRFEHVDDGFAEVADVEPDDLLDNPVDVLTESGVFTSESVERLATAIHECIETDREVTRVRIDAGDSPAANEVELQLVTHAAGLGDTLVLCLVQRR
ncbi:MAG: PAS domain-containing protein [Haloarculaceae archaeon]